MCSKNGYVGCGFVMLLLCGTFATLSILGPKYVNDLILRGVEQKRIVVNEESQGYKNWKSNLDAGSPPAFLNIYVFNVTNPDDVLEGDKPILNQVGPYVYDWKWEKFDINWTANQDRVSFFKAEFYVFNREKTPMDLDPLNDSFTFPSVPFASVRSKIGINDNWYQSLVSDLLSSAAEKGVGPNEDGPFIVKTVHEYVWGYESKLLHWINGLLSATGISVETRFSILTNYSSHEFTRAKKKEKDVFYTGKNDTRKLNQFIEWTGLSQLKPNGKPIWGNDEANDVKGSDGSGFEINLKGYPNLTVFVDVMYRHINMISNDTTMFKGIEALVYRLDPTEFANVQSRPEYFLTLDNGLTNLSSANNVLKGSPVEVLLSQPHFFGASETYRNAIELLPPNDQTSDALHNTQIYVEPRTGITIKALKRLQVNLKMDGSILLYPNMTRTVVPIVWFEQTSEMTEAQANEWHSTIGMAIIYLVVVPIAGFSLAGLLLLLAGSAFILAHKMGSHQPEYTPVVQKEMN